MIWHRLAVKLGWPVQVLQRLTTSKEFNRWKAYLVMEPNEFNPLFYYLALIAFTTAKVNASKSDKLELEDFLLTFEAKSKEIAEKMSSIEQSKAAWLGALGIQKRTGISKTRKGVKRTDATKTRLGKKPHKSMRG